MEPDERRAIAQYVDAAAELSSMPLAPANRAAVANVMERLATFAADVRAFELSAEVEIPGPIVP
jgi:ribosomal protein S12 methylthiotransferase accessory factor YcaO